MNDTYKPPASDDNERLDAELAELSKERDELKKQVRKLQTQLDDRRDSNIRLAIKVTFAFASLALIVLLGFQFMPTTEELRADFFRWVIIGIVAVSTPYALYKRSKKRRGDEERKLNEMIEKSQNDDQG